jgi:DNA replication protein DnaC
MNKGRSRGIASAIPARYRGVSFDRPPVSDMARDMERRIAVMHARDYVENLDEYIAKGRGVWFMGGTGTGKTTLGMLIAKEALAAGKTVGIYFTPKLLTRIRQTYQEAEAEDAYGQFFNRVTSVDLLYIDDLGSERHTDWVVEQLYAVVNERYENQRPMLVTSNAEGDVDKGQQQLEDQIGRRTVSRLIEICESPLPLFGSDQRYETRASS